MGHMRLLDVVHINKMSFTGEPLDHVVLEYSRGERKYPYCKKCHGCKHTLHYIDTEIHVFNTTYVHQNGWSRAWAFESKLTCDSSSVSSVPGPKPSTVGKFPSLHPFLWLRVWMSTLMLIWLPVNFVLVPKTNTIPELFTRGMNTLFTCRKFLKMKAQR